MGRVGGGLFFLVLFLLRGGAAKAPPWGQRIVGGAPCPPLGHPGLVLLYHFDQPQCGGALLSPQWVLSAAHCKTSHIQVLAGSHSLSSPDVGGGFQYSAASEVYVHPDFHPADDVTAEGAGLPHDLMLLRLDPPLTVTPTVQPLPLPDSEAPPGTRCTAMGYGSVSSPDVSFPDVPHCLNVTLLSDADCRAAHGDDVTDGALCAGGVEGEDSCQGDSGSPLLCVGSLQGIVWWGPNPCGQPGKPGLYGSVFRYREWILRTTGL